MIEIIATTLKDVRRIEASGADRIELVSALAAGGLNFHNIKEVMENTKMPQYHFGTAVRYDKSAFKDVDLEKLRMLIDTMSEVTR